MDKVISIWHIKDGKICIEKRGSFMEAVSSLPDGKYFNTTEKAYKRHSNKQNNSLFGIPYKLIAERMSDLQGRQVSTEWVHNFCKDNSKNQLELLPLEYEEKLKEEWENDPANKIISHETGKIMIIPFVPTTTKMSTVESMEYYRNLQEFGREWLDIEIPDPDPDFVKKLENR